jgi:thiol-disulfide isomerase/thioredoxin
MKYLILIVIDIIIFTALPAQDEKKDSLIPKELIRRSQSYLNKDFLPFNVDGINGEKYSNDSLRNKVTFINFWFEACAPCIAEFDALNSLYTKFKDNPRFQFLSFTYENKDKAIMIANKYKIEYPIISVNQSDCRRLNFNQGFPTNIILDESTKIQFILSGGPIDKAEAMKIANAVYAAKLTKMLKN